MRTAITSILLFLAAMTGTAFAADAVNPDAASWLELAKPVFDAVMHGQWWAAAAAAVILAAAGARKLMPSSWKTGVKGDIIGVATAFVFAFAGAILNAALAVGFSGMSAALAIVALKIGFAAVGGFTVLHKVTGWLAGTEWFQSKAPAWLKLALMYVTGVFGSDAVKKAEQAGEAAVAAKPPQGAGDGTVIEVD